MSNYYRAEYEDVAHIFARVETMINTKLLSPNEIMEEFRNEFMDLFTTKGQSFNKTRFLNASKGATITKPENLITIPEPTTSQVL